MVFDSIVACVRNRYLASFYLNHEIDITLEICVRAPYRELATLKTETDIRRKSWRNVKMRKWVKRDFVDWYQTSKYVYYFIFSP